MTEREERLTKRHSEQEKKDKKLSEHLSKSNIFAHIDMLAKNFTHAKNYTAAKWKQINKRRAKNKRNRKIRRSGK